MDEVLAEDLVDYIRESVKVYSKPGVFISGGLDSTILLHHLREKYEGEIYTYTAYFDTEEDELDYAEQVAAHYTTNHNIIEIRALFKKFKKILPHLDKPRINLWPSFLYEQAVRDDCESVYIGEGMDEHFGGYHYKLPISYQEYWNNLLEYSLPLHQILSHFYGVVLQAPFVYLDVRITLPYYDSKYRDKRLLKQIYKGIIPDYVLERRKQPGRVPWLKLWAQEAMPYINLPCPDSRAEAHRLINRWAMRYWLNGKDFGGFDTVAAIKY